MPPRYAYWTILVDNQPTAFRAGAKEDLMPTFNRLKEKNPSAMMMWFQNGKLWPSRLDAQEAMRARGEMGRRGDARQPARSSFREGGRDAPPLASGERRKVRRAGPKWIEDRRRERSPLSDHPDWKPKATFAKSSADKPPASPIRNPTSSTGNRRAPSLRHPKRPRSPEWKPKGRRSRAQTANGNRRAPSIASKTGVETRRPPSIAIASLNGSRRAPSIAIASPNGSPSATHARPADDQPAARPKEANGASGSNGPQVPSPQAPSPLRSASGFRRRNTRSRWASKPSATTSGAPAASTRIRAEIQGREEGEVDQVQEDDSNASGKRRARRSRDDLSRRSVPSAPVAHVRSNAALSSTRCAAPSRASRRSSAPRSASASCSIVLAMKHKWPSTMSTRPSSSSIPKRTYAPISIIPRTNDLGQLLFTSADAVLAYDFAVSMSTNCEMICAFGGPDRDQLTFAAAPKALLIDRMMPG